MKFFFDKIFSVYRGIAHAIPQRRPVADPRLQFIAGTNRPDSRWRSGKNDVARQKR